MEGSVAFPVARVLYGDSCRQVKITYIPRLCINGTEIDSHHILNLILALLLVQTCRGTHILHISYTKFVAKRMYCINYLVRSGVPTCDILCVYCSVIRTVHEYAYSVWHPGLTKNCLKILSVVSSYCHTVKK